MIKEIGNFLIHLRLHYQFFILSGGFLLGGVLTPTPDYSTFLLQFLNVHVLLFGGATAFNSCWDKDEGPIGGLKNPPKMNKWMRDASMLMQFAGLIWALTVGWVFAMVYLISMILFWLYSTPLARWKGDPYLSLIAIGFSTGTSSVLLGALAAGSELSGTILIAAIGVTLLILSLYPVSQIFQIDEDRKRGDRTFASRYGRKGVIRFFIGMFMPGAALISLSLMKLYFMTGILFLVLSLISWIVLWRLITKLTEEKSDYSRVMFLKFIASLSYVLFLITILVLRDVLSGIQSVQFLFN
jgi:4-hydroxybenzoate polyprenyltransferase